MTQQTTGEELKACANTDVELWRERPDDYYAPSIHRTESGGIGINVGGTVIVKSLADWHALARPTPKEAPQQGEVAQALIRWRDAEAAEASKLGEAMFMGKPNAWYEHPHWLCQYGHVSGRFLKSEEEGDLCLACHQPVILGPPMTEEQFRVVLRAIRAATPPPVGVAERGAIVAWLRSDKAKWHHPLTDEAILAIADAIERGDHLVVLSREGEGL